MVARVTHYRIRPGKVEEFVATVKTLTAAMDKLKGFRVWSSCATKRLAATMPWQFQYGIRLTI